MPLKVVIFIMSLLLALVSYASESTHRNCYLLDILNNNVFKIKIVLTVRDSHLITHFPGVLIFSFVIKSHTFLR